MSISLTFINNLRAMKNRLKSPKRITMERIVIIQILALILMAAIYSNNFFLIFATGLFIAIFISFWSRKTKRTWGLIVCPLTLITILMIMFITTLIIYLSTSQPSAWIIKTCISSFVGALIMNFYFFTMADDEIRQEVKDCLHHKLTSQLKQLKKE